MPQGQPKHMYLRPSVRFVCSFSLLLLRYSFTLARHLKRIGLSVSVQAAPALAHGVTDETLFIGIEN